MLIFFRRLTAAFFGWGSFYFYPRCDTNDKASEAVTRHNVSFPTEKEQEKRPKRRLDHTPWLHSHAVLNTQTAVLTRERRAPSAPLALLSQADFWTDDVAQKSGMTKNARAARNTKVHYTTSHLVTFFRQIIPQRLSQLSGSTKKLSPLCRRSANFFVIPPVGNKSAKLWTQNKTEIKLRRDTFMTATFPFLSIEVIHLCIV